MRKLVSFAIISVLLVFGLETNYSNTLITRGKRQLYLCGVSPFQFYSPQPCPSAQTCPNGGILMNVACQAAYQCTPYYSGTSTCLNGNCCTVPSSGQPIPVPVPNNDNINNNNANFGTCPSGQLSEVRCSGRSQCASGQTCIGGLCCTITGNEWNVACGGATALAACGTGGFCAVGSVCTSSNYCCECPVGQSYGTCANGVCPTGYTCSANRQCCPSCPNNVMPFGFCSNGRCGGGKQCYPGNICC
ncbi:unnamed protein product [Caenorhabditis bovis]|uniref:CC domain-containing protein n=1 Tax=Caenorhabditis bovis TaxID=2654633 RepID=A0A8S1EZ74_9PELO|nr:unnamed protein product [Caenorhabditis bovis]